MEFVITLLLLYLAQCADRIPREAVLFTHRVRGWRIRTATGWRLLHALPSAEGFETTRFPLRLRGGRLYARSPASRLGWRAPGTAGPAFAPDRAGDLGVSGKLVTLAGVPFYRASSKRAAERWSRGLGGLTGATPEQTRQHVEAELESSLSSTAFRDALDAFRSATRVFATLCDLYFAFLFLGIPALIFFAHEERGLLLGFIAVVVLHVLTLVALGRAYRKLFPNQTGELFEQLLSAAFYPPILLRACHAMRVDWLGGFHPAAAAEVLLPDATRLPFLRAELLRLERRAAATAMSEASERDELPELERRAVLALLGQIGVTRDALMQPPPRDDTQARAFCPMCASDYVRREGQCADCGVDLVAYLG